MTVEELVSELYYMPKDAKVIGYGGYDPEYGPMYEDIVKIEQENVGWDGVNDKAIVDVYIL